MHRDCIYSQLTSYVFITVASHQELLLTTLYQSPEMVIEGYYFRHSQYAGVSATNTPVRSGDTHA
jgi:hypothetical protein